MTADDSFPDLMARLRSGDADAAEAVFRRFARRLIGLARSQLDTWVRQKVDPEDVVQSVYRSFFARQDEGQFELADWNGLWRLLVLITVRKCANQAEFYRAARRDGRREQPLGEMVPEQPAWRVLDREPAPWEAVALADTLECLLRDLDESDRRLVTLLLQGFTVAEISAQVGRAERTVFRRLGVIRNRLQRMQTDATSAEVPP